MGLGAQISLMKTYNSSFMVLASASGGIWSFGSIAYAPLTDESTSNQARLLHMFLMPEAFNICKRIIEGVLCFVGVGREGDLSCESDG